MKDNRPYADLNRKEKRGLSHKPIEFSEKEKSKVLDAALLVVLNTTPISGYFIDQSKKTTLIGLMMSVLRNTYGNKMGGVKFIDASKHIDNYINECIKDEEEEN